MANADALEKIWPITSVRLICDIFLIIAKQTATVNTNLSLLFEPPNVFEPLADHMDKCRPGYAQLTTHAFSSAEALIDHLTSVNAVNFVCKAARMKTCLPATNPSTKLCRTRSWRTRRRTHHQ